MAMMIPNDRERPLDIPRCVMVSLSRRAVQAVQAFPYSVRSDGLQRISQMALVHDLAEAQ